MQIFGIVGWKNSGKTTLMAALVREFGAAVACAFRPLNTPITPLIWIAPERILTCTVTLAPRKC